MRILNKAMLTGHGNREGRKIVADLLDAGLDALDPYQRVKKLIRVEDGRIILDDRDFEMRNDPHSGPAVYDARDYDRILVIGAGKGIQRAALAMEEVLGDLLTGGAVIAKHGEGIQCRKIDVTLAGHPVPDAACVEGCRKIEALAAGCTGRDLVFTISGSGCGSLMTYPAGEITLDEIASFTRMMQIEKGVPTGDLNTVRTHIDRFKGGRLSRLFQNASLVHLTTADPSKMETPVLRVDYFEMLGKNNFFPPIPSPATYADAIAVIRKWDAWEKTPESIRRHLSAGTPETDNMGIAEFEKLNARFFGLIFKDATVYPAVRKKAAEFGYPCVMLSEYMQAEAAEAGRVNASIALNAERLDEPFAAPVVLMTSGELLVTAGKGSGIGGRNQEYCMTAAMLIRGSKRIVFGAVDTDGTDGPGCNGNRDLYRESEWHVFRIWDIENACFLLPEERRELCRRYKIPHVPVIEEECPVFDRFRSVGEILAFAEGKTVHGHEREGLVFKEVGTAHPFSFKAVSNRYLLKLK